MKESQTVILGCAVLVVLTGTARQQLAERAVRDGELDLVVTLSRCSLSGIVPFDVSINRFELLYI